MGWLDHAAVVRRMEEAARIERRFNRGDLT
jgi:hypothetical protein